MHLPSLHSVDVPGRADQLGVLHQLLHDYWQAQKLPPAALNGFEVTLEEAFINIVEHGGSPAGVRLELGHDTDHIHMRLIDSGSPFDPTSLPAPDIAAPLEDRRVGGLGVFLSRHYMDHIRYQRENDKNILHLQRRKQRLAI
ncbi:MAG: ATP-binding protein [Rhodoferax sp.]|nr:ATP-binding protein [Rhodoferax sp.]